MASKKRTITGPGFVRLAQSEEPVKLQEMESGEGLRQFKQRAYTGAAVEVGFGIPTVFDLSAMEIKKQKIAILRDHNPSKVVGYSTKIENSGQGLDVEGVLLSNVEAQAICKDADDGLEWEASVGLKVVEAEFFDSDETAEINGRTFEGPVLRISSVLRESSFVPLGADDETSSVLLSAGAESFTLELKEDNSMSGEQTKQVDFKQIATDIQAAFPNDPAFALDCITAGLSVDQSWAKYGKQAQAKQEAMTKAHQAELEKARAEAKKPGIQALEVRAGQSSKTLSDKPVRDQWHALVNAKLQQYRNDRPRAVSAAARENPELHKAFVMAANEGIRASVVPDYFNN